MTNKKFKMAAMSLALTACVAASPLAANAESADAAEAAAPAAQSEPEVPAEEPAAQEEAPAEEPAAAEPEASPEQEPETASDTEEAKETEEAVPEETPDEEAAEEDASSDAETAEEEASDEEQSAADETSADAAAPSADLLISRPETAFVSPMLPAEGAAASTDSPDAQISLLMPMEGEGIAVNAGQASISGKDGTTYGTLDDAIKAASSDDTILVYEDVESDGIHLVDKNLTIQGVSKPTVATDDTSSSTVKPKLTLKKDGIYLDHSDLTFKGLDVDMTGVTSIPKVDESTWMAIKLNHDSSLTLEDTDMVLDSGADVTDMRHQGIYFAGNGSNVLNVGKGSNLVINGFLNAISWNGTRVNPENKYEINVTDQSSLSLDRNGAGIVGMESLDVLVDNSTLAITNCTDRSGINGANVKIVNGSTANISDNHEGYGIHANDLLVDNSTLTANNNGYGGIRITGKGQFVNNSTVTVTGTENKGNASIEIAVGNNELQNRYLAGSLDVKNSTLNVLNNDANGIVCRSRYGLSTSLTIDNASIVTIQNNHATPKNRYNTPKDSPTDMGDIGGGLRIEGGSSATLGANTIINNNHADKAGDDIFILPGGSLTFALRNSTGNGDLLNDDGCGDKIDGWYIDAEGQRWDFHGEQNYVQNILDGKITLPDGVTLTDNGDGTYTITVAADAAEGLALKAAHAEAPDPDEPENDDPVPPENPTNPPVQDATPDTPVTPENPELPPVQDATPDSPVLPSDPVLPAVQDAHALPQTGTSLFAALAMALSGIILTAAGAWASLTGKRCKH